MQPSSRSGELIRSQPSGSATDAETVVGRILNRYRISQGWGAEPPEDHALRVASWLEILGIAEVPVEEYENCYRRAMATRMQREAAGDKLFALTPGELVAEYRALQIRRAAASGKDRPDAVSICPDRHEHKSPDEALRDYGFPGLDPEWLPCHACRPSAFERRRAEVMAARGEERRRAVKDKVRLMLAAAASETGPKPELRAELDRVTALRKADPEDPELQARYAALVAELAAESASAQEE